MWRARDTPTHPLPHIESIAENNRQNWRRGVESCQGRVIPKKMFGKKKRNPPNQLITFNNKKVTNDDKIATSFCKQFTTIVPHTSDPAARRVKRQLLRDHPIYHTLSAFTTEKVVNAIKQSSNSKAASPNGLTVLHLKHLGPSGHAFLTQLFN